jgi:hypothetical protein
LALLESRNAYIVNKLNYKKKATEGGEGHGKEVKVKEKEVILLS